MKLTDFLVSIRVYFEELQGQGSGHPLAPGYAVAALPYPLTAFSIPEPAFARSFEFMAGRTVSLALKARNHGSAIAGNSDESFRSKKKEPVRSPLSSVE